MLFMLDRPTNSIITRPLRPLPPLPDLFDLLIKATSKYPIIILSNYLKCRLKSNKYGVIMHRCT